MALNDHSGGRDDFGDLKLNCLSSFVLRFDKIAITLCDRCHAAPEKRCNVFSKYIRFLRNVIEVAIEWVNFKCLELR